VEDFEISEKRDFFDQPLFALFDDHVSESIKALVWGQAFLPRLEAERQKQIELENLESEVNRLAIVKMLIVG
jgi:hypothetical protein